MKRIAIAGFQHETNTFSIQKTTLQDFVQADNWPGLLKGDALLKPLDGLNIPLSGFIEQARHYDWHLLPLVWANATPSGIVTQEAFDEIANSLCKQLAEQTQVDAIYLDLHGAMVAENARDAEAELLQRIRKMIGDDLPIVTSLDLHANVSQQMVSLSDLLLAYRSYPHVDMAETGQRAAQALNDLLNQQQKPIKQFKQFSFLITMTAQSTLTFPANKIYETLITLEKQYHCYLSFTMGFPLADVYDAGPAIMGYSWNKKNLTTAMQKLHDTISTHQDDFHVTLLAPEKAVSKAKQLVTQTSKTIILVDTQDNPGCGGSSDTTGLLHAMLKANLQDAAIGIIYDPEVAKAAYQARKGTTLEASLGAKIEKGQRPVNGVFNIINVSDGKFKATGAFYQNSLIDIGPTAWLQLNGIDIIVSSKKAQAADKTMFQHLGLNPASKKILALKSSVHYRADFDDIASEHIIVKAPGANIADLSQLNYQYLRLRT